MSESIIQQNIMDLLLMHPKIAWAMVVTTGMFKVKGGHITVGHYTSSEDMKRKTGMNDIIGQLKDGRVLGIETKQPGEKPTDTQIEFINLVNKNNGVSFWTDSVNDCADKLRRLT